MSTTLTAVQIAAALDAGALFIRAAWRTRSHHNRPDALHRASRDTLGGFICTAVATAADAFQPGPMTHGAEIGFGGALTLTLALYAALAYYDHDPATTTADTD